MGKPLQALELVASVSYDPVAFISRISYSNITKILTVNITNNVVDKRAGQTRGSAIF